jgi:alpha-acetolactate decarboxylase
MSEIEFLGALGVELLRHGELRPEHPDHELFQTSTVQALLAGAFDGDVTLAEILEHGDLGLGTLNGLDGELIVLDGQAWKAELDCTLSRPDPSSKTPYAVVVASPRASRWRLQGLSARRSSKRTWASACRGRPVRRRFASTGASRRCTCARCRDSGLPTVRSPR